jgi:hypothetical protein
LHEAGAGDRMHGLAGRIGDEVEVKPRHRRTACLCLVIPRRLCIARL